MNNITTKLDFKKEKSLKDNANSKRLYFLNLNNIRKYFHNIIYNYKSKYLNLKKADILLINCPTWSIYDPPIGIGYLSSYLKKKHKVEIFDLNISMYNLVNKKLKEFWKNDMKHREFWTNNKKFLILKKQLDKKIDFFKDRILKSKNRIIGFSVASDNRLFSIELIKRLKKANQDLIIIVGGMGCYTKEERSLFPKELIDLFVIGEGEKVLENILNHIKASSDSKIQQVIRKISKEKNKVITGKNETFQNKSVVKLDEFSKKHYESSTIPLLLSKGCIKKCIFCNDRVLMGKYKIKPAEKVVLEIEHHIKKDRKTFFSFKDLLINGNMRNLERFCDLIIQKNLKVKWGGNAIVRKEMTLRFLNKMKEAGCEQLVFGIESGSNRILKIVKKGFLIEEASKVLKNVHKAGIESWINIIVGFPGETEKDLEKTKIFLNKNSNFIDKICVLNTCDLLYESNLFKNSEKFKITKNNSTHEWEDNKGNNIFFRTKRLKKIMLECEKLNLPITQTNVL